MCGIVAYVGHQEALPIVLKGLQRLEYRGYDSAGVALFGPSGLKIFKKKGKVAELIDHLDESEEMTPKVRISRIGIGHTRWATHGEPNDENAHPHYSGSGNLAIIHNGIIENYESLKRELLNRGHTFKSETDSEVFIHLIEEIYNELKCSLEEAIRQALGQVVGAYAIVVMDKDHPEKLIAARKGSPLVIGIGNNEFFLASDATPIVEYTNEVVYLNDFEIATIRDGILSIKTIENHVATPYIHKLELELEAIEKGGYEHFMLKEIMEQPKSIADSMRGRVNSRTDKVVLGGLRQYLNKLLNADRIIIIGCGTSWHAGLVAEYLFEELTRIPVEVEYASEFRYRNPIIREGDVVIAISQSGETADTLAAIELAKAKGAIIFGVCNAVGSSIARASHEGAYLHAGPEIGVASTKAFTSQLTVLTIMALMVGHKKGTINESEFHSMLVELEDLPRKVTEILKQKKEIEAISNQIKNHNNALYLGRGFNFPVALEGALKLKEISYIHAEGYPAAEMKHGPIALIDSEMPVIVVATRDKSYEKIISNIQEVKARNGKVFAIVTTGDTQIRNMADWSIEIPASHEMLTPLLAVIPLQLMSYYVAVARGCNVDQPRNLAKSVTVE